MSADGRTVCPNCHPDLVDFTDHVEASTAVDLLERYRRVCVERSVLVGQLATARAQAEALKGNR